MATKANAHCVDCDINPDELSWSCTGSGTASTYDLMYLSGNETIWGVPLGNGTLLGGLDAAGAAVDVGGGVVGLPYTGHPFKAGDTVAIEGTTNYDTGGKVLQASTTANRLDILDAYVAEIFDGTETVINKLTVTVGGGRMVGDSNGNLYYGHQFGFGTDSYITKIASDGTVTYDFFDLPAASKVAGKTAVGLVLTDDESHLYIETSSGGYLMKFNVTTGALVWSTAVPFSTYAIDVDSNDNCYGKYGVSGLAKFDASTGTPSVYASSTQSITYECVVDSTLGIVIAAGAMTGGDPNTMYNLSARTLNGAVVDTILLGGTYLLFGSTYATYNIYTGYVKTDGTYIYVIMDEGDNSPRIYKLGWDGSSLSIVSSVPGPVYTRGLFFDVYGNLVVVNQDWTVAQNDVFYFYDTDLSFLGKIDNLNGTLLKTWDAAAGGSWIQGAAVPRGVSGDGSSSVRPSQERNLWYPSNWSHLNGESVQVLGDGAYLGTDTVAAGTITLDDNTTTNHVGLAYTSYLQPMKLDGEVYIKDIRELLVQLYNTLDGNYGETLATLFKMIFRDRDDDFGDSTDLFSGYLRLPFDGSYTRKGDLWITHDTPLPMTVLGIIAKMDLNDGSR